MCWEGPVWNVRITNKHWAVKAYRPTCTSLFNAFLLHDPSLNCPFVCRQEHLLMRRCKLLMLVMYIWRCTMFRPQPTTSRRDSRSSCQPVVSCWLLAVITPSLIQYSKLSRLTIIRIINRICMELHNQLLILSGMMFGGLLSLTDFFFFLHRNYSFY